jgi:hypothetical protein
MTSPTRYTSQLTIENGLLDGKNILERDKTNEYLALNNTKKELFKLIVDEANNQPIPKEKNLIKIEFGKINKYITLEYESLSKETSINNLQKITKFLINIEKEKIEENISSYNNQLIFLKNMKLSYENQALIDQINLKIENNKMPKIISEVEIVNQEKVYSLRKTLPIGIVIGFIIATCVSWLRSIKNKKIN